MNARYEVRRRIGIGGHGVIYEAYDTQIERKVAIKRINSFGGPMAAEAEKSFKRETQTLASLSHPNIVKVYDADKDEEGFYLVMELLKGQSLMAFVKEHKPVAIKDFHEFALQSLDALTAAREVNVLHRDIKPTNLFLERTPAGRLHVTLLDFGLAKVAETSVQQTHNADETVMGSVHFMAPEQFEMLPLDHRTDLYSFGVCCYYMLTGLYPFDGESAPLIMASHLQHRKVPLNQRRPDLPRSLTEWVHHLIARKPEDRPVSSLAALEALEALQLQGSTNSQPVKPQSEPVKEDPAEEPKEAKKQGGTNPVLGVVLATFVCGVIAVVILAIPNEEGDSKLKKLYGQFFNAVSGAEDADEDVIREVGATYPVDLPAMETWTIRTTEPGSEVVLDDTVFSPMGSSSGSMRLVDGVGANLFPEFSLDIAPKETTGVRWTFDFRVAARNPNYKTVMEEAWGASLRPGPEELPLMDLLISPKDVAIGLIDGAGHSVTIIPERWYRLKLELNLAAGTQSGSLLNLSQEGAQPEEWSDLPLPMTPGGKVGTMRFHDRTEKTYRPNHTLHIDNVRLELAPTE